MSGLCSNSSEFKGQGEGLVEIYRQDRIRFKGKKWGGVGRG